MGVPNRHNMYTIYKLVTTIDMEPFYVGLTHYHLVDRLARHIIQAYRGTLQGDKAKIIKHHTNLYGIGGISIIPLETGIPNDVMARLAEKRVIISMLKEGIKLINQQSTGDTVKENPPPKHFNSKGAIGTPIGGGNDIYFRSGREAGKALLGMGIVVNIRSLRKCLEVYSTQHVKGGFIWRRPVNREERLLCGLAF